MIRPDLATMELLLRAELPGLPPSTNAIWRHSGRRTYKPESAKAWQASTVTLLAYGQGKRRKPYEGAVYVEVVCYTKRHQIIDADNRLKVAQDCLAMAGIIVDDSQAVGSTAWKLPTGKADHTVIEVWKILEDLHEKSTA